MQLRPTQTQLLNDAREEFKKGNIRVVANAATGFGKTVTFSAMAAKNPKQTVIWTDRVELCQQASKTIQKFGVIPGVIDQSKCYNFHAKVQIVMLETFFRKPQLYPWINPALNIIDEAHVKRFRKVLNAF